MNGLCFVVVDVLVECLVLVFLFGFVDDVVYYLLEF